MRSSLIYALFASLLFVSACSSESIPDPQKALPEEIGREEIVETVGQQGTVPGTNRWTEEHVEIASLIEQEKYGQALQRVEQQIYGPRSNDPVFYTSPAYGGFLELFIRIGRELSSTEDAALQSNWLNSLVRFEAEFLEGCVDQRNGVCEKLQNALTAEANTAWIVLQIARQKQDASERLGLLGAAFDLQSRRRFQDLEEEYLRTSLQVFSDIESGRVNMSDRVRRQHLVNILAVSSQMDWSDRDSNKTGWFVDIQPWKYNVNSNQALNDLRLQLVPFIPLYARGNQQVRENLRAAVAARVAEQSVGKKDLSEYPAYENIDLASVADAPIEVAFLALEVYFQNISVTHANAYIGNVINKANFVDELFEVSKTLVRWDIAQLGIDSTEKLADRLSQQDAITNAFFQEVLDWSKTLTPVWTEFHTVRLWSVKTMLESNIQHSRKYNEINVQEYFTSIDRNILRSVVYPNMMAFAYNMARTEWSAILRIWFFVFRLDSTLILDYMVTGQYQGPWFNFTSLMAERGWRASERKTLYRSDMYDALYYFFTTKTFQAYGINPDNFISLVAETVFKQRRTLYEQTVEAQKQIYFPENTKASSMVRWCEAIKSGDVEPENMPFYKLAQNITPHMHEMKFGDDLNSSYSLYWGDQYKVTGTTRLHSVNDRFRMELQPIYHTLNQYLEISRRIASSYPRLQMGEFSQMQEQLQQYDHFMMTYLGVQRAIIKKVDDCLFVAEKEAKRRVRDVSFAHFEYFEKVIHPLMKQVKSGEVSLDEANQVIQDFHGNQPGVTDMIAASNARDPIFVVSQVTHMVRTRMFLIEGANFQSPFTESVNVAPVVGSHLEINIPPNFMDDPGNNPYLNSSTSNNYIYRIDYLDDGYQFARLATQRTTDESRAAIMSDKFTEWDQHELKEFAFNFRYVVEHHAIFYQMPELRYYDVEKGGCWTLNHQDIGEDCIVEEEPSFTPILSSMKSILDAYRLTDVDKRYFGMTNQQGWVGTDALNTVVEFDPTVSMNYMDNTYPYSRLAGLFDYAYQLLEADTLGLTFQTVWDAERMKGSDRPMDFSCPGRRDGCYWADERTHAREFFYARGKRPGHIFNFDYQILADDFERVNKMIQAKYTRLITLEDEGPRYINEMISEDPEVAQIDINMFFETPSVLYSLSPNFVNNRRVYEQFFDEETEGFFLKEHNWEEELKIQ